MSEIRGTYRTHETTPAAMRDLLNAHPELDHRVVDGRTEVKIEGVLWIAALDGAA